MEIKEKNLMVETIAKIPKLSFVLVFIGFIYLLISILQFGIYFYDKSQLITNIVIGYSIFMLSYVYWYFKNNDRKIDEIRDDFKSFHNQLDRLENKFISFNK